MKEYQNMICESAAMLQDHLNLFEKHINLIKLETGKLKFSEVMTFAVELCIMIITAAHLGIKTKKDTSINKELFSAVGKLIADKSFEVFERVNKENNQ